MNIYFCHSKDFDYQNELYTPLRQSALNAEHTFFLPHEDQLKTLKSKDLIRTCDIVFAEVSYPATGMGIELGWADAAGVPIICCHRPGATVSGSLRFISDTFIEYTGAADLIEKVGAYLSERIHSAVPME